MRSLWIPGAGARVVVALHGTGGTPEDLVPWARRIDDQASILAPEGEVLERGAVRRFFARFPDGSFDQADLALRSDRLAEHIREQGRACGFAPAEAIAVGYSNGANIAAALMLRERDIFRAALLLRPMLPFPPGPEHGLAGRSIVLACGRMDPYLNPAEAESLKGLYQRLGAGVEIAWHEGGHELGQADWMAAGSLLTKRDPPGEGRDGV
jgi:predicted esterase